MNREEEEIAKGLKGYFGYVDHTNNDTEQKSVQKERAKTIAIDLGNDVMSDGDIRKTPISSRLEAQPLCTLCEKLGFFLASDRGKPTNDECIRQSKAIVNHEWDPWDQGHAWKHRVPPTYMHHHYGNYVLLLTKAILAKK